jgi:hypothetical protein
MLPESRILSCEALWRAVISARRFVPTLPAMHPLRFLTLLAGTASALSAQSPPAPTAAHNGPRVLRAARVLDGTGRVLTRQDIVVQGGRITAMKTSTGPLPAGGIDLGNRTVLPRLRLRHRLLSPTHGGGRRQWPRQRAHSQALPSPHLPPPLPVASVARRVIKWPAQAEARG